MEVADLVKVLERSEARSRKQLPLVRPPRLSMGLAALLVVLKRLPLAKARGLRSVVQASRLAKAIAYLYLLYN